MGELLAATKDKRAKGTKGQLNGKTSGGPARVLPEKAGPTLAELGISKNESMILPTVDCLEDGFCAHIAVLSGVHGRRF